MVDKYGHTFNEKKSVLAVEELQLLGYKVKDNEIWPDTERFRLLRELKEPTSFAAQERIVGYFSYYSK